MALIVIHGDADVVEAGDGLGEEGVGGLGAFDFDAGGSGGFDGGDDVLALFGAEEATVAGVGIEAGDADAGALDAEAQAGFVGELDDGEDAVLGDGVAGVAKGDVGGDVDDAEIVRGEHHGEIVGPGEVGEDFGVAGKVVAGEDEGFLVDWGGDGGVDFAGEGEVDQGFDGAESGVAGQGGDFAEAEVRIDRGLQWRGRRLQLGGNGLRRVWRRG